MKPKKPHTSRTPAQAGLRGRFVAISWHDLAISFGPIVLLTAIAAALAFWLVNPAPPNVITIAAGPRGSVFWSTAEKYQAILAHNGITARLLVTDGSLDNLRRLADPAQNVDVGFVQGGVSDGVNLDSLMSLGSIAYVPLVVFYVGKQPVDVLSELAGKRVAIGPPGSGTRLLALTLLKANGIVPGGATQLVEIGGDQAADGLTNGTLDAAFLMGDSATPPTLSRLIRAPGVRLIDFTQADAYTRRFTYLNVLSLPRGVFDFGRNLPTHTIHLIAPTAELVARDSLHPALSDLLIDAAQQVHGQAGLFQRAGEFPVPLAHEYPVSADALRYYKSGKSFLYRNFPFWVASLADRLLVILVPIVVLLIPGARLVPAVYSWRIKSRIYRWYGALIALERSIAVAAEPGAGVSAGAMPAPGAAGVTDTATTVAPAMPAASADAIAPTPAPSDPAVPVESHAELLARLDHIEAAVNRMKVPLAYAEQFYVLREHIDFVRIRLLEHGAAALEAGPMPPQPPAPRQPHADAAPEVG